jgi:glycosyltransferase involved in cell wall biosynthesis
VKILWHSNCPWVPTGYGQQTAEFTPRIRDLGHEIEISGFWGLGGAALDWEGMKVYPADDKWGNVTLAKIGESADLVITLMDVWVLTAPALAELPLASWVPVDHNPLPPRVRDFFGRTGSRPIAMSRFGERMLLDAGLDPLYVPHGIDTNVFAPRPEMRAEVREMIEVPEDAFVVGMVAANKGTTPPRKAFPQVFQAFAEFRKDHPDAYLYLHTELSGRFEGLNLGALAAACGIPSDAIKRTPPWRLEFGVPADILAAIYGAFDVLANPSYGEGFGIPIIEAQACGVPVIVTDHSAMTELCGAGWLAEGEPWYDPSQGAFFKCPSVRSIREGMEAAYERRGDTELKAQARTFAEGYDADLVTAEFWVPTLEDIERRLSAREPKPLKVAA